MKANKKYPRLRIQKRADGWWQIMLVKDRHARPDEMIEMSSAVYWFDARNTASRLCGRPVRFTKTLNKH